MSPPQNICFCTENPFITGMFSPGMEPLSRDEVTYTPFQAKREDFLLKNPARQ